MEKQSQLSALLQDLGYRITPQRLLIIEAIQRSAGHLSAEEVHAQIQAIYPYVDISTVYRTLELLASLGLVRKTDLTEGHTHYEWSQEPHQHTVCQRCGNVGHFGNELLDELWEALRQGQRFYPTRASIVAFGLCDACAQVSS
ncbi:MAG: transcriptional repressor [Chloroflexi bacterium]|nr:transcriptional repressor [Chloroflexota bacterium]